MDGGKAVALSVVLGMVLAFVPLLAIVAVPLLPIPLAFLTTKHGVTVGVVASLAVGALCFIFSGPAFGLLAFLLAAIVGVGFGWGLTRRLSQTGLIILLTGLFLITQVLWVAVLLVNAGTGPVEALQGLSERLIEEGGEAPSIFGEDAASQVREAFSLLPYILPAVVLVLSLVFSGATVAASRWVFNRLKQPFAQDFSFGQLRMHFSLVYAMIAGLICYLVSPYIEESYSDVVYLVGLNLLIISQVLFFIQFLAIVYFFLDHFKVSRPKRVGVYACALLMQLALSLPSWIGLFDIWIDYRRRFTSKSKQSQQH